YIIAGPMHTLVDGINVAKHITGIPAPRSVPAGVFKTLSAMMGVVEKFVPLPEAYTREGLRGIAGVTYVGDNSKARRDLGYTPRPLKEGLAETLRHEMNLLRMK
ncbi:MAG: NAD-dependent epimerase/dehydratase family protein, partial [Gammaproteobacteria bacterium]